MALLSRSSRRNSIVPANMLIAAAVVMALLQAQSAAAQIVQIPGTWMEEGQRPPCQARATLQGHKGVVTSLAVSPDGKTLATAGGGRDQPGEIKLWDVGILRENKTLRGHTGPVLAVAF